MTAPLGIGGLNSVYFLNPNDGWAVGTDRHDAGWTESGNDNSLGRDTMEKGPWTNLGPEDS